MSAFDRFRLGAAFALLPHSSPTAETVNSSPSTEETPIQLEAYKVTSIRQGLASSIETKQKASVILDSISAEGIGKFPDNNLTE